MLEWEDCVACGNGASVDCAPIPISQNEIFLHNFNNEKIYKYFKSVCLTNKGVETGNLWIYSLFILNRSLINTKFKYVGFYIANHDIKICTYMLFELFSISTSVSFIINLKIKMFSFFIILFCNYNMNLEQYFFHIHKGGYISLWFRCTLKWKKLHFWQSNLFMLFSFIDLRATCFWHGLSS